MGSTAGFAPLGGDSKLLAVQEEVGIDDNADDLAGC